MFETESVAGGKIKQRSLIGIKDQILANLLLIMTSTDLSSIKESLESIKLQINTLAMQEEVSMILLSESSTNAIPLLSLTLAFPDLVSTSVAIFLALSFLQNQSD